MVHTTLGDECIGQMPEEVVSMYLELLGNGLECMCSVCRLTTYPICVQSILVMSLSRTFNQERGTDSVSVVCVCVCVCVCVVQTLIEFYRVAGHLWHCLITWLLLPPSMVRGWVA